MPPQGRFDAADPAMEMQICLNLSWIMKTYKCKLDLTRIDPAHVRVFNMQLKNAKKVASKIGCPPYVDYFSLHHEKAPGFKRYMYLKGHKCDTLPSFEELFANKGTPTAPLVQAAAPSLHSSNTGPTSGAPASSSVAATQTQSTSTSTTPATVSSAKKTKPKPPLVQAAAPPLHSSNTGSTSGAPASSSASVPSLPVFPTISMPPSAPSSVAATQTQPTSTSTTSATVSSAKKTKPKPPLVQAAAPPLHSSNTGSTSGAPASSSASVPSLPVFPTISMPPSAPSSVAATQTQPTSTSTTSATVSSSSPSPATVKTCNITSRCDFAQLRSTVMEAGFSQTEPYRILYLHTKQVHAQMDENGQQQLGDVALAVLGAENVFWIFTLKKAFLSEMAQGAGKNENDELRQLLLDPTILKVAYDLYGLAPFLRHVMGDVESLPLQKEKVEEAPLSGGQAQQKRKKDESRPTAAPLVPTITFFASMTASTTTEALINAFKSLFASHSPHSSFGLAHPGVAAGGEEGQGGENEAKQYVHNDEKSLETAATAVPSSASPLPSRRQDGAEDQRKQEWKKWQRISHCLSFLDLQLLLESEGDAAGKEGRGGGKKEGETRSLPFDAPISALLGPYSSARSWPQEVMQGLRSAVDGIRDKKNRKERKIIIHATTLRLQCILSGDYHAKGGARPVHLHLPDSNESSSSKEGKRKACSWELHRARVLYHRNLHHNKNKQQQQQVGGADGGDHEEEEEEEEEEIENKLQIFQDTGPLLELISPLLIGGDATEWKEGPKVDRLLEFVLDLGHRPRVKLRDERLPQYLHTDPAVVVEESHLQSLIDQIGPKVGHDHRAGIDGTLHRISVIPDRARARALGATLRVGRHVTGNAGFLYDLLEAEPHRMPSILVLGPPGTGKTTIIRELARLLSLELHLEVLIVDTSNEIAGDGYVTHPSVGLSRRMMVRTRDEQADVMVEGVQNHTPEVMVIDEIGRLKEVRAARTIKERGVALIGSAHGDFCALLRNPDLKGLLGGLTTMILGDEAAKKNNKGEKLQRKREHEPVFDTVVELQRGNQHEWHIYRDVSKVVDAIYAGKPYMIERRVRDATTGRLYVDSRVSRKEIDFEE